MRIKQLQKFDPSSLSSLDFDLTIISSGYESRSTFLVTKYDINSHKALCLGFKNYPKSISRIKNDRIIRDKSFKMFRADGYDSNEISQILDNQISPLFNKKNSEATIRILIDYSCMTRVWYSKIVKFIYEQEYEGEIDIFFSYSLAKFNAAPSNPSKNETVGPLQGYSGLSLPDLPTALIIGLGYVQERAFGLTQYLDALPFVFYTDESDDNLFSKEVENNNSELLSEIERGNIYTYSISDKEKTYEKLKDLCLDLKNKYRVIIAPCGPKPFALVSLLLGLEVEDIDIWRISAGSSAKPVDKPATGQLSGLKVTLCSSE